VLSDINFVAEPGQTTAFIGSTGSGKSTLINLIPRFYDATRGNVEVFGEDVRRYRFASLRGAVGMVLQKAQLFRGTIADNVRFGNASASTEVVEHALGVAQASEFVQTKEGGLDYVIEQNGRNLSGGQKQRIAIVRSLCMNPEIILFDEVTAALDPEMVREVLDVILGLAKDGMTMLIVTHEMNFARQVANRIVFMDKGQIIEQAKPEDFFTNPTTDRAKTFLNILNYEPRGTNYEENI